jgi:plastocyanin
MPRTFLLRCVMSAALLAAASCGGGGSPSSPSPPTGQPSPQPPPSGATTIAIVGDRGSQSFNPNPGTVSQSRTVVWRNNDSIVHRIVLNDGSVDTGNIAPGASTATLTLPTDGTNYHCSLHPGMIGAINASGGAPPPCTGTYC